MKEYASAVLDAPSPEAFMFECSDVTGTYNITASDIQPELPVGVVARALASRLSLPEAPWALRDDASAAFLADEESIGSQIVPGAKLTLTPKAHLGGRTA